MRLSRLLLTVFAVVSVLGWVTSWSGANDVVSIYPFPNVNKTGFGQYELFQMRQGWHQDELVWFIATDTNSVRTAYDDYANYTIYWQGLTLAPKLTEAADDVANVYIVLNFQQGPVFTEIPGGAGYSGVWRVIFILYHADVTPHPITNTDPYDPDTNPSGLPPLSDADRLDTDANGRPVVVKYPILAVGPLGGPWLPAPLGRYRIPQAKVDSSYPYTKQVWLPFWLVYCQDPATKHVSLRRVIVPDVWDPASVPDAEKLAPKLGANVAPGLALIPLAAEQDFFYMNGPKPFNQYPVLQACPTDPFYPWRNTNLDYSPVMVYNVLDRLIPPYAVINNPIYIDLLLTNGKLIPVRDDQIINAPVIPELPNFF